MFYQGTICAIDIIIESTEYNIGRLNFENLTDLGASIFSLTLQAQHLYNIRSDLMAKECLEEANILIDEFLGIAAQFKKPEE